MFRPTLRSVCVLLLCGSACGDGERGDWRRRLESAGRDQLPEIVAAAVEERIPGAEARVVEDYIVTSIDGVDSTFYLDNLWRELDQEGVDRPAVVARYIDPLATTRQESPVDRAALLPIVRPREYTQVAVDNGAEFPSRDIVGELIAIVAEDSPTQTRIHELADLEEQGFTRAELFEIAMKNLAAKRGEVRVEEEGPLRMLVVGSEIESSFLLLAELWDELARPMKGPLIAAVPARDLVVFADSADPEAVAAVREVAKRAFAEVHHPVSAQLIVWQGGSWQLFSGMERGR